MVQKKSPPTLNGYSFTPSEANIARKNGTLLTMRTELNHVCNFHCLYCNERSNVPTKNDIISFNDIAEVILQANELGAKSVGIIGGGEPTLYPKFSELVTYIYNLNMIPLIFSNGTKIDSSMAKFLFECNASIILKCDSLNQNIQNDLAGYTGAYKILQNSLSNLLNAGFAQCESQKLRLGLSFVSTQLNADEIPEIWRYCRQNNIFPNHEILIPRGRAHDNLDKLALPVDDLISIKEELHQLDLDEFGYDWNKYMPITGNGCLQVYYSIYLSSTGFVRPCADIDIQKYSIYDHSIKEILSSSFFQLCRDVDNKLEGKCKNCDYLYECIGCRGLAYSTNILKTNNPSMGIMSEDPFCWKSSVQAQ